MKNILSAVFCGETICLFSLILFVCLFKSLITLSNSSGKEIKTYETFTQKSAWFLNVTVQITRRVASRLDALAIATHKRTTDKRTTDKRLWYNGNEKPRKVRRKNVHGCGEIGSPQHGSGSHEWLVSQSYQCVRNSSIVHSNAIRNIGSNSSSSSNCLESLDVAETCGFDMFFVFIESDGHSVGPPLD